MTLPPLTQPFGFNDAPVHYSPLIKPMKEQSEMKEEIILVTGATGNQGGAAARHLYADGWRVRALVRNLSSAAAAALAQGGIELAVGDLDDPETVKSAMQGVYGVFSVQRSQFPGQTDFTVDDEIRQGKLLADLAKASGVRHFVYTSVGGVERNTQITSWKSKWIIEKYIRVLGLPATFLRPVAFMENYLGPMYGLQSGALASFSSPDIASQVIAIDDVGAFAALVFGDRDEYLGQAFELAGDAVTVRQIAAAFGSVLNREINHVQIPFELLQEQKPDLAKEFLAAQDFAARGGWHANIPELPYRLPSLKSLDQWLAAEGGARLRALVIAPAPGENP